MKKSFLSDILNRCEWLVLMAILLLPRHGLAQSSGTNFVINIAAPTNGQVFGPNFGLQVPPDFQIIAKAADAGGNITNVEFFANTNALGAGGLLVLDPPGVNGVTGPVYVLTWSGATPGVYALTAVASDNQGATATSPPVNITVEGGPLPLVRITSPANHAFFRAPVDLPITAYALDTYLGPILPNPSNSVTNVEFFAGANDLGAGHRLLGRGLSLTNISVALPFQFGLVWSNAPAGSYVLAAVATDALGLSATSTPVNITIVSAPPPLTNLPNVVSIVATDPIAIVGSNSWSWYGPTNPIPSWTNWPPPNGLTITNWGPKDALFTVSRFGATGTNLTLPYSIGGTASNGVDYATLPGTVTIAAGESSALIAIVPIDNGPAPAKTVVLTLAQDTNVPPTYLVGVPSRAEALIVENWPRPLPFLLPDGSFNFNEPGPDGAWFRADWSDDLLNWTPLCTNQIFQGSIDFLDADAPANPLRYYRAVPLDGPP
jgi:hypothetical protein